MRNSNKDKELSRLWKLQAKVNKLVLDGKRSPERVANFLQKILEESQSFELYLHPTQAEGRVVKGTVLEEHLRKEKPGVFETSLQSPLVQGWIRNPKTYPEELKGKAVFLWGEQKTGGGSRHVAYLVWDVVRVVQYWYWVVDVWDDSYPALLAGSSEL